jgi:ankyrin repeat protein
MISLSSLLFQTRLCAAQVLLDAGAPLHALDSNKQNVAHHAARAGRADCLALLVSLGVQLGAADRWHRLPLSWAALNGHYECVQIIVTAGLGNDVNFKVRCAHVLVR